VRRLGGADAPAAGSGPLAAGFPALILVGCVGGDPTADAARELLADGFTTGLNGTMIEAEGGTIVGGYDAWLLLRPTADLSRRFGKRVTTPPPATNR
jgi:hypothetical protein